MENEKSMITTELLGIRTGLSMISKYTDEIKKEEEKISDTKSKHDSLRSNAQKKIDDAKKTIDHLWIEVSDLQEERNSLERRLACKKIDIEIFEQKIKHPDVKKVSFIPGDDDDNNHSIAILFTLGTWAAVLALIYPLRWMRERSREIKGCTNTLHRIRQEFNQQKEEIQQIERQIEKKKREV